MPHSYKVHVFKERERRRIKMYRTFTRTWWKENRDWPNGLEPCAGQQTTLNRDITRESDARRICEAWNATHKPGRLGKKMEYTEQ